jgi:CheY-like chemotaxis protein
MSSNVKILVVDDNPMVLAMLQQALAPLGAVAASGEPTDALLKAVENPPDLLISDYRMPGMDGGQLLEKLKERPATAGIAVILMATKADINEHLEHDSFEECIEKPFFLKDAVRKIKRVVDRIALEKLAKAASTDGMVRGNLAQMNVIDLVQSLEMGRKSCLLTLSNAADKCEIYFNQGQATHAVYGPITGDQAVFKVLRWTQGNFQIDFEAQTAQQSTTLNTQGLLMEGLRLLDEANRDKAEGEDVLIDI